MAPVRGGVVSSCSICRDESGVAWGAAYSSALASAYLSATGAAYIDVHPETGTSSHVQVWEHASGGLGCVDRAIERARQLAAALGWPTHTAEEWRAIFGTMQRLLDDEEAAQ